MKKMLTLLLTLSLVLGTAGTASAAGTKVIVDGKTVNGECIIQNGRVLAPVRAVAEAMGATVQWDEAEKKATVTKFMQNEGYRQVLLWIGRDQASINGMHLVDLNVPAQVIGKTTMMSVRDLEELLECQVDWDQAAMTATISSVRTLTSQGQAAAEDKATGDYLQQMTDEVNKKMEQQAARQREEGLLEGYGYWLSSLFVADFLEDNHKYIALTIQNYNLSEFPKLTSKINLNIVDKGTKKIVKQIPFYISELRAGKINFYDIPTEYVNRAKYDYEVRIEV